MKRQSDSIAQISVGNVAERFTNTFMRYSGNRKTGAITVTRSLAETCSLACALYYDCYAKGGPSALAWSALERNDARPSHRTWDGLMKEIRSTATEFWRFNEAGDLPGLGHKIDARKLAQLCKSNAKKRGFTYTHKPVFEGLYRAQGNAKSYHDTIVDKKTAMANRKAIAKANKSNFTINLSADTFEDADRKIDLKIGPVVCILPIDAENGAKYRTPAGRKIVTCTASLKKNKGLVDCLSCQLCADKGRKFPVGFPAHGFAKKRLSLAIVA